MTELTRDDAPAYRNLHVAQLLTYRLPLAGVVSLLHRASGAVLFVSLPFLLYLLNRSLTSEISFAAFKAVTSSWSGKLVLVVVAWAYLHHVFAGVRFLFIDVHVGLDKDVARKSALAVLIVSLVLTALIALKLLGAF
jgi:succinate dehydrogenase / fumarate reductase, cytochrome b subunit